jgi:hypothetical protein
MVEVSPVRAAVVVLLMVRPVLELLMGTLRQVEPEFSERAQALVGKAVVEMLSVGIWLSFLLAAMPVQAVLGLLSVGS